MRTPAKHAFSLVELLVVVTIIGVLVALLLPAVQSAREAARRSECSSRVRQLSVALHSYAQTHDAFPPGCIVSVGTHPEFDSWTEASAAGSRRHGTSWMLLLLPYIEQVNLHSGWDFTKNVVQNAAVAQTDIAAFYCPSRRKKLRNKDSKRMLDDSWTGGGTDYGGCLGAGNGWSNESKSTDHHIFAKSASQCWDNGSLIGIFSPNGATGFIDIKDGTSNTIMIGELQRLDGSESYRTSQDGWALGGVATLFTTAMNETGGTYQIGGLNNNFFESPGSDHPGGAHLGMADGSVHFIANGIDTLLFRNLGGMADGQPAQVP